MHAAAVMSSPGILSGPVGVGLGSVSGVSSSIVEAVVVVVAFMVVMYGSLVAH